MFTDTQTIDTSALRKFMFDRSFDNDAAVRAPERKPVTLKPDQYDALKQESYDAGFAAGRAAGMDEQNQNLIALLARVDATIQTMTANMQAFHKQSEAGMRQIALAIAKKVLPNFAARNGLQEIEALLAEVMGEMVHEPRLVIRINETQFDAVDEKVTALSTQKAYAGKVVVLADAEIAVGDCRIEWADGGMERNAEATMQQIEQTLAPHNHTQE